MSAYRTADADLLLVGFGVHLVALHPETGARIWQAELPPSARSPHVWLDGPWVRVGSDRTLLTLERNTGLLLSTVEVPIPVETLLVHGDHIYVASQGEVACVDPSGRILWHEPFRGMGLGRVALARGADVAGPPAD